MKIAVQIFGHMRTFQKCAPVLRNKILSKYDCDVFIHTWDKPYHDNNECYSSFFSEIIELYNPKEIKIEKQDFFDTDGQYIIDINSDFKGYNVPLAGLKYMNYSMFQANSLRCEYQKKHHLQYDYIICVRPDIFLDEDFDILHFVKDFEFNINTLISFSNYPVLTIVAKRININFLANDVFMLMTPVVANRLFGSLVDFEKYYVTYPSLFPKYNFHPESSFSEMVLGKNIYHRIYIYSYTISRKNSIDDEVVSIDPSERYFSLNQFSGKVKKDKKIKKYRLGFALFLFLFILSFLINFYQLLN